MGRLVSLRRIFISTTLVFGSDAVVIWALVDNADIVALLSILITAAGFQLFVVFSLFGLPRIFANDVSKHNPGPDAPEFEMHQPVGKTTAGPHLVPTQSPLRTTSFSIDPDLVLPTSEKDSAAVVA